MKGQPGFAHWTLHMALALAAASANAGHVSETLSLSNGWNAVYVESTPDAPAAADFFADMPHVLRVGCYESSVFGATEQIASDGTTIAQKPVAFYVWERGMEEESTLQRIIGGHCYLMYATNATSKTFYGIPAIPKISWQNASDGFYTIAGVSISAGETVPSGVYFREGPLSVDDVKSPYTVGGTDSAVPVFLKMLAFRGTPALLGGCAYAFAGKTIADWPGVVKVSVPSPSEVIAFGSGKSLQSFSVGNAGTTNRTIRVAYGPSELAGEVQPPLQVYIPRVSTNKFGWTAFSTHDFALASGESRQLILAVDKSSVIAGTTYGALITVSDTSGTKMRVRVPVTATAEVDTAYSAAYPRGLWYGNVTLSQVDRPLDGVLMPAGGEMNVKAIVLVDNNGAAHLMQRVAVGAAKEVSEDGSRDVRLWPEASDVPSGYASRRISAVFPDVAHRSLAATSGVFGSALQFDWTVAADARDNPFRHVWHPDHATGFAVTNRLSLSWSTEAGEPTFAYEPNEVTYGICTWRLGGLSAAGDITMRGTFALKRILSVSKMEEQ